jgi:putative Holliday junction resolvase
MNYLSIDLWDKRCWLAYTNMDFIFMLPYVNRVELISNLKKIIKDKNISKIIIWMPYDLYWKDYNQLEKTKKFTQKLKINFPDIEIIEVDERFTTIESINILKDLWSKNIQDNKDSMSAYLILETFLNKKNKNL